MYKVIEDLMLQYDIEYGGDLNEYLGLNWEEILQPFLEAAWYDGYTNGKADNAREPRNR